MRFFFRHLILADNIFVAQFESRSSIEWKVKVIRIQGGRKIAEFA